MFENGLRINDKHTFDDWGLVLTKVNDSKPEVKTSYLSIPGKSGLLDLSESLTGRPQYNNRELTLEFICRDVDTEKWHKKSSEITNYCHGKVCKIVLDADSNYYYLGRVFVETDKEYQSVQEYALEIDAEPFKYEINSSIDDWLWDDIDFEEDVIRDYRDLPVSGTTTYTIIGSPMPSHPVIESNASMKVLIEGNTFNLKVGKNKMYDILLEDKEYEFTFIGNGKVTIEYRGGKL